ncbi:hypothetical protein DUI87_34397 [Hirundo rustica rustica]|uniref:ribonuclease H n=1 Tax=Hirundo rustica rustica TaxID=333673 RepID=A0A3M0IJF5_HIRRU|nr:hypothetical protein DUI87_34397 [Hirundo rustica rustica]
MRNSPTLCLLHVAWALQPIRKQFSETIIYHYMDDILFCQASPITDNMLSDITTRLSTKGLVVAPEKVQCSSPWKYLGWMITTATVQLQKPTIKTAIQTLSDVQQLTGELQWLRLIVGLTNEDPAPFTALLRGTDPALPVNWTPALSSHLQTVLHKVANAAADCAFPDILVSLYIGNLMKAPFALLLQVPTWQKEKGGKLEHEQEQELMQENQRLACLMKPEKMACKILEWLFPPQTAPRSVWQRTEVVAKLLQKGRQRYKEVAGKEPATITMPLRTAALEWLLANSSELQLALLGFPGQIRAEKMSHPALRFLDQQEWQPWPNVQSQPLPEEQTVFTDAGRKTRLAVCVWQKDSSWHHHKIQGMAEDSLQTLELRVVIWALGQSRDEDLNIVSDSLYVVGVVQRIEEALLRMPKREILGRLFIQLQ